MKSYSHLGELGEHDNDRYCARGDNGCRVMRMATACCVGYFKYCCKRDESGRDMC
jgi:hypothetical protein